VISRTYFTRHISSTTFHAPLTHPPQFCGMPNYLRPKIPGATIFFTVALANRQSDQLVREIARLRDAVRITRTDHPFDIEAWVVLPDHLHCIWRLPPGDRDFPTRWRLIKSRFSRGLPTSSVSVRPGCSDAP
jgi:putative transposase